MLHVLGRKQFYLKVDTDTLVLPQNLLGFLDSLAANTRPGSRLYFGNRAGMPQYERYGKSAALRRPGVRDTAGWAQLERSIEGAQHFHHLWRSTVAAGQK